MKIWFFLRILHHVLFRQTQYDSFFNTKFDYVPSAQEEFKLSSVLLSIQIHFI